eukprot:TRINITY_DN7596_c0_g1_i2.p1 TRINITY_DN7596_c0_g1~~TRINITY_DN7596_c0_g1_i2.p1  ORF type:complete len:258 (+),score=58.08 TRINITY_DN7596_c0_g1_i2:725-1498(+)
MKESAYKSMEIVNDFITKTKDPAYENETLSIMFETPYAGNMFFWIVIVAMIAVALYMTTETLIIMDVAHVIIQMRFFNILGMETSSVSKYSYLPHEVDSFSVQIKRSTNRQNKNTYDLIMTDSGRKVVKIPSDVSESSVSTYNGYVAQLNTALSTMKERPEALIDIHNDPTTPPSALSAAHGSNDGELAAREEDHDEQNDDSPFAKDCRICWDGRASEIFLPCGHVIACFQCSRRISECPLCRKQIERYQTIRKVTA